MIHIDSNYPFKPPFIKFKNTIYHPNICEKSGNVCLDILNKNWSPMFDLVNIFEVFIPQLLDDPNARDPLNGNAAKLLLTDKDSYTKTV